MRAMFVELPALREKKIPALGFGRAHSGLLPERCVHAAGWRLNMQMPPEGGVPGVVSICPRSGRRKYLSRASTLFSMRLHE